MNNYKHIKTLSILSLYNTMNSNSSIVNNNSSGSSSSSSIVYNDDASGLAVSLRVLVAPTLVIVLSNEVRLWRIVLMVWW